MSGPAAVAELNRRGVPAYKGGEWFEMTVWKVRKRLGLSENHSTRRAKWEHQDLKQLRFEWPAEAVLAIDEWRKRQPGGIIGRNEAAFQLVMAGLLANDQERAAP